MKRFALVAIVLAASAASTRASAGTYVGLGIGTAPSLDSSMSQFTGNGRSWRLALGQSFGRLAVEGLGSTYDLTYQPGPWSFTSRGVGVALKYNIPLGNHFEVFGRGGLQKTWLDSDAQSVHLSGDGYLLGAGFEYKLDAGLAGGSIWIDYNRTSAQLSDGTPGQMLDDSASTWTAGVTLAL